MRLASIAEVDGRKTNKVITTPQITGTSSIYNTIRKQLLPTPEEKAEKKRTLREKKAVKAAGTFKVSH
jgi:hypothetical protein